MGLLSKKFISPEGEQNLTKYKYSGSDASYLYKYVFSPIAQFCVDHLIPSWLAPNVITLAGFFCTLIPHVLVWITFPNNLEGPVPAWLCFLAAVGQITYMILDNSDGKQARKTGTSSPLGLLFDHGCDAMNTFISGLTLFTVIQFGNGIYSLIGYTIAFSVFFMATWEEFYVEALNLPCFNGANEGIVGVAFFFLLSGIFGTNMWNNYFLGFQLKQYIIIFFTLVAVYTIYGNCKTVKNHDSVKFGVAMNHLAVMLYLVATVFITYCFSVTDVLSDTARIFIYFIGFNFSKLVGIMQASHCAHVDFDQWRTSILISTTLLNANTLAGFFMGHELIPEKTLMYGVTAFAFLAYAHFVYNIIHQFTNVLRIRCFRISRPIEQKLNSDFPLADKGGREGMFFELLKNSFFKKRYLVQKETITIDDTPSDKTKQD